MWRRRNGAIPDTAVAALLRPAGLGSRDRPLRVRVRPLASSVTVSAGQRAQANRCLVYVHPKSRSTSGLCGYSDIRHRQAGPWPVVLGPWRPLLHPSRLSNQLSHRYRCARRRTGVKIAAVPPATSLLLGAVEAATEPDAGSRSSRGRSLSLRARGSVSSVRPRFPGRHLLSGPGGGETRRRWKR